MTRVPTATYRVQLTAQFPLQRAAAIVPYLHQLGVSDLYASPLLQARRGSTHGYDFTDPNRVDAERGGESGLDALHEALTDHAMGLLLDIVPNHMAASPENPWWRDLLRHGPASRFARHFDIDWDPIDPQLRGRVLVPFVDGDPGAALDAGRIRVVVGDEGLALSLDGTHLPLDPASVGEIVTRAEGLDAGADEEAVALLARVGAAAAEIPGRDPAMSEVRATRTARLDAALAAALRDPAARARLDEAVAALGPAALQALLGRQAYVLSDWRDAPRRVNYRRFFDVNDLVCLRVDDPTVFHDLHRRLLELVAASMVTGLRVDHIDGLTDPHGYLMRLQETFGARAAAAAPARALGPRVGLHPFYVLVEKILVGPERLPATWPVSGATGYESSARIEGLFVDSKGLSVMDEVYSDFIGERRDYAEVVHEAKQQVVRELFPGVFEDLARRLHALLPGETQRRVDLAALRGALEATAAAFPVYRTYCRPDGCLPADHQLAHDAVQAALRRDPRSKDALDVVAGILVQHGPHERSTAAMDWLARWQQTTGPVMAKGYEDTALYRYFSLVSLNEVGDRPGQTVWLEPFHDEMMRRLRETPDGLNASSTHDSKRSEDVRARLNALTEVPDEWSQRITAWREMNAAKKTLIDGVPRPGPDMEYLLYETLVGAWPLDAREEDAFPDRVAAYMQKAAREAKRATSWLRPDPEYEAAMESFVRALASGSDPDFTASMQDFVELVAPLGMVNSLAQTVLRCTTPGIPDTYQGQELWDLSLVDPDNRRPIDFARRIEVLDSLDRAARDDPRGLVRELLAEWRDGRIKAYVLHRLLVLRRERPHLFARGEYIPLGVDGTWHRHVVAFARHLDGRWALVVVPRSSRLVSPAGPPLGPVWQDTRIHLPAGAPASWSDRFSGRTLRLDADANDLLVADALEDLPVVVLTDEGAR